MDTEGSPLIVIRRQFDDARTARCRVSDLRNVHWDFVSGGAQRRAPWPFMYGYVWCNDLLEADDFPHSCLHGARPHSIKVCIVKKDNDSQIYGGMLKQAGPKPFGTRGQKEEPTMTKAKAKELLALAKKSKKADFLKASKDVPRDALEAAWNAAQLMKKAERMGRRGIS